MSKAVRCRSCGFYAFWTKDGIQTRFRGSIQEAPREPHQARQHRNWDITGEATTELPSENPHHIPFFPSYPAPCGGWRNSYEEPCTWMKSQESDTMASVAETPANGVRCCANEVMKTANWAALVPLGTRSAFQPSRSWRLRYQPLLQCGSELCQ